MPEVSSRRPIEIRGASSSAEVDAAVAVSDSVFNGERGWQTNRTRHLETYRAMPELLSIAVDDGRIVGGVGCDGTGVVEMVAILEEWRGRGLGRRLLERAEDILRARGIAAAALGSLDGAVGFYQSCGYQAQLLMQFTPEVKDPELVITELLAGPLAGREVVLSAWQGHPQLWLQGRTLDWELKRRVEDAASGVVAQYVMSKQLRPPLAD